MQSEDDTYLFSEILKNKIVYDEFERIKATYGQEAFNINRIRLIEYIKKGAANVSYSVKYYGVDEDQIGILSRRVPYEDF